MNNYFLYELYQGQSVYYTFLIRLSTHYTLNTPPLNRDLWGSAVKGPLQIQGRFGRGKKKKAKRCCLGTHAWTSTKCRYPLIICDIISLSHKRSSGWITNDLLYSESVYGEKALPQKYRWLCMLILEDMSHLLIFDNGCSLLWPNILRYGQMYPWPHKWVMSNVNALIKLWPLIRKTLFLILSEVAYESVFMCLSHNLVFNFRRKLETFWSRTITVD